MQIQKFHQARDFLEQFEQNNHWQLICAIYIHEKNAQKWSIEKIHRKVS